MSIQSLKGFQEDAVTGGVSLFAQAKVLLDAAGTNLADHTKVVNHNGYLLIEAPTGSGKTLMAGTIVERFSHLEDVVWFWFAPFKGVGGQSEAFLREQFHGLRLRELTDDRAVAYWTPQTDHYELTLRSQALGAHLSGWTSRGGFDAAGVAPLRYTESRRGRELRAANFQRDNGLVTFSGPAVQYPLVPGAQDRLSWMVQLAAVLAADPALAVADAQVRMWVVGTRGDAEVWTFTVQGRVALDLPIGRVEEALHLTREPRRPYDTQVQVWLDPVRHFVPVKVALLVRATGEGTVLELRQLLRR